MTIKRYLHNFLISDLQEKMVFLAGPRQVGKTTLGNDVMFACGGGHYYLWDNRDDRKELLNAHWPAGPTIVVLDELHKYRKWKQWLKGEYDKHRAELKIIVTGSARMDVYRKGGDSLQGRYHHWRLHPFSLNEISGIFKKDFLPLKELVFSNGDKDHLVNLLKFGGFPEPILAGSERTLRRWQKERMERFFREDLRDLENIRDVSSMQILSDILPDRVGSPLSLNSLREDLDVSHRAITHWIDVLERLYYIFRVRPWTSKKIAGLKKEAKAYLWDWSLVQDEGHRFENMVASHLLKFCHFLEDSEGYKAELYYWRDVDKREVDFIVTMDRKPWFAVEAKLSDEAVHKPLKYLGAKLDVPFLFQVTMNGERDFMEDNVRIIPAAKFLSALV